MKLGVGPFTCQRMPGDDRPYSEIYAEMLDLVQYAEEVGLDSVWVSEHHFVDDGYLSGVIPSLGAIAQATERLEFGSCIAIAPFYDPVRLAEDAATLDLISDGRLTLGLGVGYRDVEFEAFDVPKSERAERIEDTIRVLNGAWSEGPLDVDPEFHPIGPDRTVTPTPERSPPIVLAGSAQPAVRRAARLAAGWAPSATLSPDAIEMRREDLESVRESEGIDGEFTIYPGARGFVADDAEAAWDAIEENYTYLNEMYDGFSTGDARARPGGDRSAKERAVFGEPAEVVSELEAYAAAAGEDTHFIYRVFPPGVDGDEARRCLELLGDEVAPELR